ncbi:MAG TPA: hypothetical protein VFP54_10945 [Acidimicrobiales bacterium]|nr:hypothetical protein [Acidimicrobiales bacterium]
MPTRKPTPGPFGQLLVDELPSAPDLNPGSPLLPCLPGSEMDPALASEHGRLSGERENFASELASIGRRIRQAVEALDLDALDGLRKRESELPARIAAYDVQLARLEAEHHRQVAQRVSAAGPAYVAAAEEVGKLTEVLQERRRWVEDALAGLNGRRHAAAVAAGEADRRATAAEARIRHALHDVGRRS